MRSLGFPMSAPEYSGGRTAVQTGPCKVCSGIHAALHNTPLFAGAPHSHGATLNPRDRFGVGYALARAAAATPPNTGDAR